MLLPVTNVCYSCGRKLPPSPRSNALAHYACSVAHVRADGSLCSVGLTAIVPSHDADELMRDDARWSDEFHAPMVRYVRDIPSKSSIDYSKFASVFEAEIQRVAWLELERYHDDFLKRLPRFSLPLPKPITDRDPGDEQPEFRFKIQALPRW